MTLENTLQSPSQPPSTTISPHTSPIPLPVLDPAMYTNNSPIFDVPEFPPLRRVKPLPKRRRTSPNDSDSPHPSSNNPTVSSLNDDSNAQLHPGATGAATFTLPALAAISPDATTEELIAHAEELSAQMALQSYYMPILGGVQDFIKNEAGGILDRASATGNGDGSTLEWSNSFRGFEGSMVGGLFGLNGGNGGGGRDDDDDRDGDYVDHLPQRGNTKKRKVPANLSGSPRGAESVDGQSGGEEEGPSDRGIPVGGPRNDLDSLDGPRSSVDEGGGGAGGNGGGEGGRGVLSALIKWGKVPDATLVGLQHKEMLKSRKRQLAAVLGALTHGDTLALDQALSAHYPLLKPSPSALAVYGLDPKVQSLRSERAQARRSSAVRRRVTAAQRAAVQEARLKAQAEARGEGREENQVGRNVLPIKGEFTFSYPSKTAIRLVETRKEVAELHSRFEAELARQAAKAAEAAKQAAAAAAAAAHSSKKAARAQQKARTTLATTTTMTTTGHLGATQQSIEHYTGSGEQAGGGTKKGKKKKRSALANASNPHHLRNYVPSRLPNQGQTNTAQAQANAQNYVSPLPLRFLSAQVPPRRRSKTDEPQAQQQSGGGGRNAAKDGLPQLVNPIDEWICPFCEYQLFYGDDAAYRRAVRNRKKILKRRRRARERAAAAASGNSAPAGRDRGGADEEDEDDYEPEPVAPPPVSSKKGKVGAGVGDGVGDGDRGGEVHAGR